MPNRIVHTLGGLIIGLPIIGVVRYFLASEFSTWLLILSLLVSLPFILVGSHLPDIIEPPKSPNHRKFFHSVFILFFVFSACFVISFVLVTRYDNVFIAYPLLGLFTGYFSHLLLDSTTKAGLS